MSEDTVKGGITVSKDASGKYVWEGQGTPEAKPDPNAALAGNAEMIYNAPRDSNIAPADFTGEGEIQIRSANVRTTVGHNVDVAVTAGKAGIQQLKVLLDGRSLVSDYYSTPRQTVHKHFNDVGSGSPGAKHKLEIVAIDADGNEQSSLDEWEDFV